MNLLPLLLVAALIGALLPVQAGVNAQLRLALSNPLATARPGSPLREAPSRWERRGRVPPGGIGPADSLAPPIS